MLITNGKTERNIDEKQLPEYEKKGYAAVEIAAADPQPEKGTEQKDTAKKAVT